MLTGPDGISSELGIDESEQNVAYEVANGSNGMPTQSAPTFVMVPEYYLPVPTLSGPGNLTLTLTGAVEARNTPGWVSNPMSADIEVQ